MAKFPLTPEQSKYLKQMLKEGFIYQRLHHHCGYKGNGYFKDENGKWRIRKSCPRCHEALKMVSVESVFVEMIEKAREEGFLPPKIKFNKD